jgi:hypothetical protein
MCTDATNSLGPDCARSRRCTLYLYVRSAWSRASSGTCCLSDRIGPQKDVGPSILSRIPYILVIKGFILTDIFLILGDAVQILRVRFRLVSNSRSILIQIGCYSAIYFIPATANAKHTNNAPCPCHKATLF